MIHIILLTLVVIALTGNLFFLIKQKSKPEPIKKRDVQTDGLSVDTDKDDDTVHISLQMEKHATACQIAGKAGHEFNNILGIILGYTEILLLDSKDDAMKNNLESIHQQTLKGRQLIQSMVTLTKDQEISRMSFSLNEKLEAAINLLQKELSGIEVTTEFPMDLPKIESDPGMIDYIFIYLMRKLALRSGGMETNKLTIKSRAGEETISFTIDASFNQPLAALGLNGENGNAEGLAFIRSWIDRNGGSYTAGVLAENGYRVSVYLPVV